MDDTAVWAAIDAQRVALVDLLRQLDDDAWGRPSLCAGWTVRDVAAHLTFAQAGLREVAGDALRARGRMDVAIRDGAIRRARQRSTAQLIDQMAAMIGSRRHVPVVTCRETLIDALVHSQDIAIPVGRPFELPAPAAAGAADRVWQRWDKPWPRARFRGYRLVATDTDWSVGSGAEVRAPMGVLLLVLTGRTAALPALSGPGAPALAGQLATARGRVD
jgi:uncharacterized protein (TIGR03083 family)